MSRFDRGLSLVENGIAGLALGGAVFIAILQVILRYVFNYIIFWSEEAVIYLIILSTFVGAVITLRHNEHVGVDLANYLVGERGRRVLAVLAAAIVVLYCAIFGAYAWIMITEPAAQNTETPALDLPLWIVELSVPIGLTLMLVRALEILYRSARGRTAFPEAEGDEFAEEEAMVREGSTGVLGTSGDEPEAGRGEESRRPEGSERRDEEGEETR